jgi:hypothetical protein
MSIAKEKKPHLFQHYWITNHQTQRFFFFASTTSPDDAHAAFTVGEISHLRSRESAVAAGVFFSRTKSVGHNWTSPKKVNKK